jgi:S-adenosylmethionine synthetase
MPVVAAQRLVTLLEISRMTGVIPDIGPDGKVQVTMEYNGDTPVRITTVVVSVQHKEDTDINKLADLLDEYVFPLAFDGMPADDAEIILNPSGKFVQGGPDADTGLTGRKLMVDTYGTFAPHGGGAFSGKDPTKVDRSGAYMARYIAKNIVATHLATRCQVTLAYAIGQAEPVMVDVNTFGTCDACEDDCLAAAVRKAYDLTPAGIIKQLNLTNPIYKYTAAGGHFGRKDFPWEKVDNMSDFISYIQ